MSSPAPSRDSNAATPACSTMNTLAPEPRATPANRPCVTADNPNGTTPPRPLDTAGRDRSTGNTSSSGNPSNAPRQNDSCSAAKLPGSPTSPSNSRCHNA
ncbi:hypothetical protein SGRIM128S_00760 [Streptomyces griseomycini]